RGGGDRDRRRRRRRAIGRNRLLAGRLEPLQLARLLAGGPAQMRAWLLVCALAACDSDHGRALDLTFTGACGADRYQVQITTVPPTTLAGGGNSATVGGSELVALLPDDTSHADIQVTAFAGDSAVASAMISVDFSGPGEISRAIAFDSCADLAAGGDLSLDLAGADLA